MYVDIAFAYPQANGGYGHKMPLSQHFGVVGMVVCLYAKRHLVPITRSALTVLSKTYDKCGSPRRVVKFLKLGLWNVRSCVNDVKFKDIHRQLVEGRFRLAVLTETRMPSGSFKVNGDWVMHNAGHDPNYPAYGGVGFLVDTKVLKVLPVREYLNRLASIAVESDSVTIDIIGCYGPTECSDSENKKDTYYWLLD
ncbi:hypothetical protein ACTXT7_004586 [Hymenolepis weldensis]